MLTYTTNYHYTLNSNLSCPILSVYTLPSAICSLLASPCTYCADLLCTMHASQHSYSHLLRNAFLSTSNISRPLFIWLIYLALPFSIWPISTYAVRAISHMVHVSIWLVHLCRTAVCFGRCICPFRQPIWPGPLCKSERTLRAHADRHHSKIRLHSLTIHSNSCSATRLTSFAQVLLHIRYFTSLASSPYNIHSA